MSLNAHNYTRAVISLKSFHVDTECKPTGCNYSVSICIWVIVRARVNVFASLRSRVGRTLSDLSCQCFSPHVMVK